MLQNGGAVTAAADVVKDVTTQSFMKDVIEEIQAPAGAGGFLAPWCGLASSSRRLSKRR